MFPRLPTIGGQPVWPIRFFVAVGAALAIGILSAWWWSFPVFFGAYFGLAFIDLRIQRWKLAHYQETGRWPWERESDITEDERMLRDVDRAAREVGMPPSEFVNTTRRFMAMVDQAGAQKGDGDANPGG